MPLDRLDDPWLGVAQRDRAKAHPVLDELVAGVVPDMAPIAADEHRRRALRELIVALAIRVGPAGITAWARSFRERGTTFREVVDDRERFGSPTISPSRNTLIVWTGTRNRPLGIRKLRPRRRRVRFERVDPTQLRGGLRANIWPVVVAGL